MLASWPLVEGLPLTIEENGSFANLFPNPNTGLFTIAFDQIEDVNIRIVSVSGSIIKEEQVQQLEHIYHILKNQQVQLTGIYNTYLLIVFFMNVPLNQCSLLI